MKKGFTLIEILAVITLLSILIGVISITSNSILKKQKDVLSDIQLKSISGSVDAYITDNIDNIHDYSELKYSDLANEKYVEKNIEFNNVNIYICKKNGSLVYDIGQYKNCSKPVTYGLRWNSESDTYERLEEAEGKIANASYGNEILRNDFDSEEIFSEIVDVNEDGNSFVKIPKFYIKKVVNGDIYEWYVSKTRQQGYYLPACFYDLKNNIELDYVLVGKYSASLSSNKLVSISSAKPLVETWMDKYRMYVENNNVDGIIGYQLMDIHIYDAIQVLFYIEFGTLDSQSIMFGRTNNGEGTMLNNGSTDSLLATSGSTTSNSDSLSAMKYRGIENLYCNLSGHFIDGIYVNLKTNKIFVNKNPLTYGDYNSFNTDYEQVGYELLKSSGFTKKMGYDSNHPFIQLPSLLGGSTDNYYADYYSASGNEEIAIVEVGGFVGGDGSEYGGINYYYISLSNLSYSNTGQNSGNGTRIMKRPI